MLEYSSISCLPELSYGMLPGETVTRIALHLLVFEELECVKGFQPTWHVPGFQAGEAAGDHAETRRKSWSKTLSLLKSIDLPLV